MTDPSDDTMGRANKVIDSVEFRVATAEQITRLDMHVASLRRWSFVVVALLVLNWLHDLGASAEMLDWWDGREAVGGFMSTELEHEITVLTPLLLALVPILWGRRRDRQAKAEHEKNQQP